MVLELQQQQKLPELSLVNVEIMWYHDLQVHNFAIEIPVPIAIIIQGLPVLGYI